MSRLMPRTKDMLESLGHAWPTDDLVALRPGKERFDIVTFLVERFVRPSNLAQLLGKVDEINPPPQLPEEERQAHRFSALLKQIGVITTPDVIRGCTSTAESLSFLDELISLIHIKEGPATASQGAVTAAPDPISMCMPAIDFACSSFSQLTAESSQPFPSDITKATAKHIVHADSIISSCRQWSDAYTGLIDKLKMEVQEQSKHATMTDNMTWKVLQLELGAKLRDYLKAIAAFSDVYAKELSVWCESLPPAQTYGIGQQAAAMLEAYQRVSSVLESINIIKSRHEAILSSKPPLAAYQPQVLLRVAENAHREAALLAEQVQVLQKAMALHEPKLPQAKQDDLYRGQQSDQAKGVRMATDASAMDVD